MIFLLLRTRVRESSEVEPVLVGGRGGEKRGWGGGERGTGAAAVID